MIDEQRFLLELPQDGKAIGNGALQRRLGWKLTRYRSVREQLLRQGLITLGKGRGGSVRLLGGDMRTLSSLIPLDGSRKTHARIFKELDWDTSRYNRAAQALIDGEMVAVGPRNTIFFPDTPVSEEWRLDLVVPNGVSEVFDTKLVAKLLGWTEEKVWRVRARCLESMRRAEDEATENEGPEEEDLGEPESMPTASSRPRAERSASSPRKKSAKSVRKSIFVAYARADEGFRSNLDQHLTGLRHSGVVDDWSDQKILPGEDWAKAINGKLECADIVLLLVSADFLGSKYCYGIEMVRALERHELKKAQVVPIILRHCDWKATPLGKLQALPRDGVPISRWADPDEAFVNVVDGIRMLIGQTHS